MTFLNPKPYNMIFHGSIRQLGLYPGPPRLLSELFWKEFGDAQMILEQPQGFRVKGEVGLTRRILLERV